MVRTCKYCHKQIKWMTMNGKNIAFDREPHSVIKDDGFSFGKDCIYLMNGTKIFGYYGYDYNKETYTGYVKHKCKVRR